MLMHSDTLLFRFLECQCSCFVSQNHLVHFKTKQNHNDIIRSVGSLIPLTIQKLFFMHEWYSDFEYYLHVYSMIRKWLMKAENRICSTHKNLCYIAKFQFWNPFWSIPLEFFLLHTILKTNLYRCDWYRQNAQYVPFRFCVCHRTKTRNQLLVQSHHTNEQLSHFVSIDCDKKKTPILMCHKNRARYTLHFITCTTWKHCKRLRNIVHRNNQ